MVGDVANTIRQLLRYGLVGVINTGLGFLVIAILALIGIHPFVANAAGFSVGLLASFVLNSRLTFRTNVGREDILPFLLSFGVCYSLNIGTLVLSQSLANVHVLIPQILAVMVYNVSFFVFMKIWVFSTKGANGRRA